MHPRDYEDVLKNYKKTRDKLQTYIDCVSSSFGNTGITVYEVLGNAIAATPTLQTLLDDVRKLPIAAPARIDKSAIADIVSACDNLEAAWNDAKQNRDFWMGIGISNIDPFSADEILQNAKGSSEKWQIAHEKRLSLSTLGISKGSDMGYLTQLQTALRTVPEQIALIDMKLVARLKSEKNIAELRAYLGAVEEAQKVKAAYDTIFFESLQADLGRRIEETEAICRTNDLLRISTSELDRKIEKTEQLINELSDGVSLCEEILNQLREASEIKIQYLLQACKLATQSERDVLSVRDRKYEKPETREFLKKYQAEAASLKQRQKLVREVFDIDACPDIDEIEEHSKILLNASIFSFFTVKYHSSKKFYKSIALDGKWHRKDAIKKMRSLLAYLKGNRAFSNDAAIKALLGNNYDGMNTNFDLFEKLLNFYEDIDNGLRGLSDPYLREFMCTAEIESIFSLPQVDPGHVLNNFKSKTPASIREDLLKLRKKYESLKTASVALESLIPLFKVPEAFDVQELKKEAADIKTFQAHWLELNSSQEIRVMLGDYFKGALTDRELIEPSLKVAECAVLLKGHDVSYLEAIEKRAIPQYLEIIERVINTTAEAEGSLEALAALVQCGLDFLKRGQTFAELAKHLHEAAEDKAGLIAYSSVALCSNEIKALGYEKILLKLSTQTDFHIGLADKIGALICQAMAREVYASHGEVLSSYNGVMLDNLRKKLASLDREIMTLSQKYLRSKLIREANLSTGSRSGKRSEWTDMALLNHEITKKGRYIPVRDMTSRAGAALMEIKPCWMLSPLAVAQYIKKGQAGFDLVIIDEASQMTPEDAVGALARGEQAMVVGDTNQLPPMSFFQKHFEEDDDDDAEVLTEESILEMSNAILRPARRLKWHYRSRDESLIAFSNKYIYDNELVIFPSPTIKNPDMGVSLESVKGLYSKGTNPEEAKVMIDAAVNFMRNNPQKSLGVVVLNQKQRDLLLEEFNFVLANDSSVQRYVDSWENTNDGLEQFFIKNLENVQGDERDAIFIGTVYGPEKEGAPVMQRFGPINGVTGKRRLNVLFTRAKQRIVTFSSMTGSDIRADDSNVGVSMLKKWLEYSATGTLLTDDILQNRREPDSMFEQYVINQLKTIGCEVTPQVGIAGYFIDIGISHPQWPHGYIMGVECDGATYHSSKSARDRDRLREEVLRGLGWHLHRIWSTDWFDDPIKQTQRLRQAVEDRLEELQQEMASPQ
jgi:very-short-patch-repair endonuclease